MIKGILFDKDGTLIDFQKVWGPAAQQVAARLCAHYGLGADGGQRILAAFGIRGGQVDPEGALAWKSYHGIAEVLAPLLGQGLDTRKLGKELAQLFYEEAAAKRTDYPTFTDVRLLMKELTEQGIRVGLATTDDLRSTWHCMEVLGAQEYISFWGTAGQNLPEKPDGRLVALAARHWKLSAREIAVVGDTPNDLRFARHGGACAWAVLSGVGTREALAPQADQLLASVAELPAWLEKVKITKDAASCA